MDGGLTTFILDNFGTKEIMVILLFGLIINYLMDLKNISDMRHFKMESRLSDAELQAKHDIDMAQIRGEMNTQYHLILEKISDNGTLFEQRLKEHNTELIKAIATLK